MGASYGNQSDFHASERAARRRAAGLPCVDPPVVLALDRAFFQGEIRAGEVEVSNPGHAGAAAWRADADGDGDGDGDLDSAFGDDEETGAFSGNRLDARDVLAYSNTLEGFDDDAQRRSPPNPWPGEVQWGAPGAHSESEWSDADSEELRRWAPEPR